VFYDPTTRRAGFGVASRTLADGNYRATLAAGAVQDSSANPNAAATNVDFFILAADGNRDRRVNLDDFTTVAANFGLTERVFSQGNYDYSAEGLVDLNDFTLLASQFGKTLPAPADAPRGAAATNNSPTPAVFSNRLVDEVLSDEQLHEVV
jgi:hypothetical protein